MLFRVLIVDLFFYLIILMIGLACYFPIQNQNQSEIHVTDDEFFKINRNQFEIHVTDDESFKINRLACNVKNIFKNFFIEKYGEQSLCASLNFEDNCSRYKMIEMIGNLEILNLNSKSHIASICSNEHIYNVLFSYNSRYSAESELNDLRESSFCIEDFDNSSKIKIKNVAMKTFDSFQPITICSELILPKMQYDEWSCGYFSRLAQLFVGLFDISITHSYFLIYLFLKEKKEIRSFLEDNIVSGLCSLLACQNESNMADLNQYAQCKLNILLELYKMNPYTSKTTKAIPLDESVESVTDFVSDGFLEQSMRKLCTDLVLPKKQPQKIVEFTKKDGNNRKIFKLSKKLKNLVSVQ